MDLMDFTQIIPRIRVYETKLLDKAKIDRMIDSSSSKEALKVLQETEYANVMNNVKRAEDYEIILSSELKRVYALLYSIIPEKKLIDIMSLKYDYHNAKVFIKGKILKKDFSHMIIPIGIEDPVKLKYAIDNEYFRDLNPIIREAIEVSLEDFISNKDPQRIDVIIDKYMFDAVSEISKEIKDDFLEKYIKSLIDLTNLKTLLRVKKQNKGRDFLEEVIIDGGSIDKDVLRGLLTDSVENIVSKLSHTDYAEMLREGIEEFTKTNSASLLEKLVDNYIMKLMKEAKFIPFGPEPVLAYVYAKETEIKVVRIIMVGKLNNIASEVIKERLRDIYV